MISEIEIKDVGGGAAPGCAASFNIETEATTFGLKEYIVATATPGAGYVFDHWEYDQYKDETFRGVPREREYHNNQTLESNPSGHNIYDSDSYVEAYNWRTTWVTTRVAAVFKKIVPPTTGKILRSATSGEILRAKTPSLILRDE